MADYTFSQLKQISALRAKLKETKAVDMDIQIKALKDSFKSTNLGLDEVGKLDSEVGELPSLDISLDSNTPTSVGVPRGDEFGTIDYPKDVEIARNVRDISDFALAPPVEIDINKIQGLDNVTGLNTDVETPYNIPEDINTWDMNRIMAEYNKAIDYKKKNKKNLYNFLGNEIDIDFNAKDGKSSFTDFVEQVIFTQQGYDWNKFNELEVENAKLAIEFEQRDAILSVWNSLRNEDELSIPTKPMLDSKGSSINEPIYGIGRDVSNKEKLKEIKDNPYFEDYFEEFEDGRIDYTGTRTGAGTAYRPGNFTGIFGVDDARQGEVNARQQKIAESLSSPIYMDMMDKSKKIIQDFAKYKTANLNADYEKLQNAHDRVVTKFTELTNTGWSAEKLEALEAGFDEQFKEITDQMFKYTDDLSVFTNGKFVAKNQKELDEVNALFDQYNAIQTQVNEVNDVLSEFDLISTKSNKIASQGLNLSLALDDSEVANYEGQYVDSVVRGLLNDWTMTRATGRNNREFYRIIYGVTDDSEMPEAIEKIIVNQAASRGLMTTENMSRYKKAKTPQQQFALLGQNPVEIIADLVIASLGQFSTTGWSSESIAPAAAVGVTSSVIRGGAFSGTADALLTWQAITGFNMEMGNAFNITATEEAKKRGFDESTFWTNKDQILEILSDEKVQEKAFELGTKRGIPIAAMSIAGVKLTQMQVRNLALKTGSQKLVTTVGVIGTDAATEGLGEMGALAWGEGLGFSDDKFWIDTNNEILGGLGSTSSNVAVEVSTGQYYNTAVKNAEKLKNLNYAVRQGFSTEKVKKFATKLFNAKKITKQDLSRILKNNLIVDQINAGIDQNTSISNSAKRRLKSNVSVRKRLQDLFQSRNMIMEQGATSGATNAKKNLDIIQLEIDTILNLGIVPESKGDQFTTFADYMSETMGGLTKGVNFLKTLGLDSDIEIIELNENSDKITNKGLLTWVMKNEGFATEEEASQFIQDYLNKNDGSVSAFITSYTKGEKQWVVTSNQNIMGAAQKVMYDQDYTTGSVALSHEILHAIMDRSFSDEKMIEVGAMLETYLTEGLGDVNTRTISEGTLQRIKGRMDNAAKKYGKGSANYYQELFTSISDEMQLKNITWERADKKFYQDFADKITDFYKYTLGMTPDVINGANISTGKQAFDFLKDYNNSFLRGGRGTNLNTDGGTFSSNTSLRDSEINAVASGIMGGVNVMKNKSMSKAEWKKISNDVIGEIYPMLDKIVGARITEKMTRTPDFSRQDFISETKIELIPHIRNFDPSENDNLAAWIKSQAVNKGKNALNSGNTTSKVFSGELNDKNVGTLIDDDVYTEEQQKTWFELLDIKEDNPVYKKAIESTITALGSRLPMISQNEFKKQLQASFENSLYDVVFSDFFGHVDNEKGKGNLTRFTNALKKHGEAIYEKLDQSIINRRYNQFKVLISERASTKQSDLSPSVKNRTAGNQVNTRKPYDQTEFIEYFTKSQTRKESLAKTLAAEFGFDATIDVMQNNPEARNRFEGIQEITNDDQLEIYAAVLAKAINRPTPSFRDSEVLGKLQDLGYNPSVFDQDFSLMPETVQDLLRNELQEFIGDVELNNTGFVDNIGSMENLDIITENYLKEKGYNLIYKEYWLDSKGKRIQIGEKIVPEKNGDLNWTNGKLVPEYSYRYIVKSEAMENYVDKFVFKAIGFIPHDQINASENVANQQSNFIKQVLEHNVGSIRSGIYATNVAMYDFNGELLTEELQMALSQEQHAELVEHSKKVYKEKRKSAINKALNNKTKASPETIALWDKFNINKIILGNKSAGKLGHILSIAKDIANKDLSAIEKIAELRRTIGTKGIAAIKMGKIFMKAYHSSLNDMIDSQVKAGMSRAEAVNNAINNLQKTTNAVFSARAYAAFSSFHFVDGKQNIDDKFTGWKGEHVDDSSTVTSSIIKSYLQDTYIQDIDGILSGFEQSFLLNKMADTLDKLGGRNSPLGNLRFLLDGGKIGKTVYDLITGKNMYEVAMEEFSQRLKIETGYEVTLSNESSLRNSETIGDGKIRIFDFDDTLARSKSKVTVTMPESVQSVTNTGDAKKVINTVYESVINSVANNNNIKTISFSSEFSEKSRVKLYNSLANKLSKDLGWKLEVFETVDSTGSTDVITSEDFTLNKGKDAKKIKSNKNAIKFKKDIADNLKSSFNINGKTYDVSLDFIGEGDYNLEFSLRGKSKGKTYKINATEFAKQSADLEAQGAKFDFSEFNKVIKGKKGPLFEVAEAIQEKRGTENVFVLTARPQAAATAIKDFLDGVGLNIPIENITGLEDGKPEAKASWIEGKIAEGYNDFYFADDAIKNVAAVKDLLDKYDVKGTTQLAKLRNSETLNQNFNQILFDVSKIPTDEVFSEQRAKRTDVIIKQNKFFLPPAAEDFEGLIYQFLGKGKIGEEQMAWFEDNLMKPFGRGINAMNVARMRVKNQYEAIKAKHPLISGYTKIAKVPFYRNSLLNKETDYSGFTYGDATRVYMWNKAGYEIPGLSDTDIKKLIGIVEDNQELKDYADQTFNLFAEGYVKPDETWEVGNIDSDIQNAATTTNRNLYLKEFLENSDSIFGPINGIGLLTGPTANKISAIFGMDFLEALSDSIYRMRTGRHRAMGTSKIVNGFMNWINNSIAVVMFVNGRSAILQSISNLNFLNWTDNNPAKAALAVANFPQFLSDFVRIFNSDFLKSRRSGNKFDVSADEIAAYVKGKGNKVKAMFNWFMRNGFVLTQMVDSWAIASGGAAFFRNRTQTYQAEGFSLLEAEEKAFFDMQENAEKSQQSSRPDKISSQQAGSLGRLVLAFANTPMQYNRLMKKAYLDAKNGRGDLKTNLSKIAYYGLAQNYIFNALQQALFAVLFDDEDPCEGKVGKELEKCQKAQESMLEKNLSIANSMLDSILRGSGVYGAVGATIKNMMWEARKQSKKDRPKYVKVAEKALSISPPISSKYQRLKGAGLAVDYNKEEMMALGLDIDNPAILATGQVISAVTNFPIDRIITKVDNVRTALEEDTKTWQSIFLMAGWDQYSLDINKYELPEAKKQIVQDYKDKLKEEKNEGKPSKKKKRKLIINNP